MKDDIIVFDIETKKDFAEVGGRENLALLEVSVLCAYSYLKNKFYSFEEKDLKHFVTMLESAGKVVGFNIKGFDLPVLQPYCSLNLSLLPVLDLMDDVIKGAGFRISLDNLCSSTLGAKKSANGLDAVKWFREGKINEIKKYCTDDVKLTRDLYEYGKKNNYIIYFSRDLMDRAAIPVSWGEGITLSIPQILKNGFENRFRVEIDYLADPKQSPAKKSTYLVDIQKIGNNFFEGYCNLLKGRKIFKTDQVLGARITSKPYRLEEDAQKTLL
ncbi:ribonuclease H-like domain-containing protein [Candidatus Giovannonibacteria bacterium]|nr:ribonuclease H-like domain-containing protein [Candidatus Giovannonibacteria bacterium]